MFRKPRIWVAFVLFAAACAVFGVVNFPNAFLIILCSPPLTMLGPERMECR